jgi:DNA-binding transcriptional ArsR family regulator
MSNLVSGTAIAGVASLIGDVARANVLAALMGGRALTAGELARHAGVTAQTTSGHLAKLIDLRLLAVQRQGRHRYYRLASLDVAQVLEALMAVAAGGPARHRPTGPRDEALRAARTCYDHLAGRLGVGIAAALCARGHVELADGVGAVTEAGRGFLAEFGIETDARGGRPLCRACLGWSERRPHLAGRLGAALLDRLLTLGWLDRVPDSRAMTVTAAGRRGFALTFEIEPESTSTRPSSA